MSPRIELSASNGGPVRDLSLDLAKALAIGAVVLQHSTGDHFARFEVGSLSWLIVTFLSSAGRYAVPLFFLCSGAIMNDPGKDIPIKKLFSKYLLRFFLAWLTWSVLYEAVAIYMIRDTAPITELLYRAGRNLFYGTTHYHLYFIWLMSLLYLSLPLTRLVARYATEQESWYIILFGLLCGVVMPFLQNYFPINSFYTSLLYFVLPSSFICPVLGLLGWKLHVSTPPPRVDRHVSGKCVRYIWYDMDSKHQSSRFRWAVFARFRSDCRLNGNLCLPDLSVS